MLGARFKMQNWHAAIWLASPSTASQRSLAVRYPELLPVQTRWDYVAGSLRLIHPMKGTRFG